MSVHRSTRPQPSNKEAKVSRRAKVGIREKHSEKLPIGSGNAGKYNCLIYLFTWFAWKHYVTAKFYFIVFQNQQMTGKKLMNRLTLCHANAVHWPLVMTSKGLLCMNIKMGSCHANLQSQTFFPCFQLCVQMAWQCP